MRRLTHRELQALRDIIPELYLLRNADAFVSYALKALPTLIPADACRYGEGNLRTGASTLFQTIPPEIDNPRFLPIWKQWMHEQPVAMHYNRTGDGRAYRTSDFYSQPQWHRKGLYNELYRPWGLEDDLNMNWVASPPTVIGLVLARSRRSFTEGDRLQMDLLRPHFAQAWRNAQVVTRVEHKIVLLRQMVENLEGGFVVLNRRGEVQLITERARDLLAQYFAPIQPLARRLPEELGRWVRHQETQLNGPNVPPARLPLVVEGDSRRLVVRLLPHSDHSLLYLEEHLTVPEPARLERLNLTRREAEVLAWVAQGKTNGEIGIIMGISWRTVRKHVEHFLVKLGVENRTGAASLALQAMHEGFEPDQFPPQIEER